MPKFGVAQVRFVMRPIFLDQCAYSLNNAALVLFLASYLTSNSFSQYALAQAVALNVIALQRATVGEPALAVRTEQTAYSPFKFWAKAVITPGTALFGLAALFFFPNNLLIMLLVVPVVQDALRYRCFLLGHTVLVLVADVIWLMGSLSLAVALQPRTVASAMIVWTLPCVISMAVLLFATAKVEIVADFPRVFALGRYGIADAGVAALTALGPLLVAQAVTKQSSVGAFRLAQTAFGPLNIITSSLVVSLLVMSPHLRTLPSRAIQDRVKNLGRRLSVLAAAYCLAAGVAVLIVSSTYSSEIQRQLLYAFPITAVGTFLAIRATAAVAMLRSMGEMKRAFRVRLQIVGCAGIAVLAGFAMNVTVDFDPLVVPVAVTGVATAAFWARGFRRYLRERVEPVAVPRSL